MKITTKNGSTWEVYLHQCISRFVDTPINEDGTPDRDNAIVSKEFADGKAFYVAKCGGMERTADTLDNLKKQLANL